MTGAAGVLLRAPGPVVLLQLRAEGQAHSGTWSLPGGAREIGETYRGAAQRELLEETGIPPVAYRVSQAIVTSKGPNGWKFVTVIAHAAVDLDTQRNQESIALRWVPVDKVDSLPLHPRFRKAWPGLRKIITAPPPPPPVWPPVWTPGTTRTKIQFVCTHNLARSVMAETVFRALLPDEFEISSAGTMVIKPAPAHPEAIRVLTERGYPAPTSHTSRPIDPDADLYISLDSGHDLHLARSGIPADRRAVLLDWTPDHRLRDVPDPYSPSDFDHALDLIESGMRCVDLDRLPSRVPTVAYHGLEVPTRHDDALARLDSLALEGQPLCSHVFQGAGRDYGSDYGRSNYYEHIPEDAHRRVAEIKEERHALRAYLQMDELLPDSEIEAWRVFYVPGWYAMGARAVLHCPGVANTHAWFGRTTRAQCGLGWDHAVPDEDCSCGVRGVLDYRGLRKCLAVGLQAADYSETNWRTDRSLRNRNGTPAQWSVALARVKLHGPIMRAPVEDFDTESVLRAGGLTVKELWCSRHADNGFLLNGLRARYKCDVHLVGDDMPTVARELIERA